METKKYSLPKEFAEKWLTALRSGEYEQGSSYLSAYYFNGITGKNKFCCLGVACVIEGLPLEDLRGEFILSNWPLPENLKGDRSANTFVRELTDMNDGTIETHQADKKSFPEIADWIEQNVNFI